MITPSTGDGKTWTANGTDDGTLDREFRTFLLDGDSLPAGFLRALVSEAT